MSGVARLLAAVLTAGSGLLAAGPAEAAGPAITVAPVPVATGGQVTVSGTGFCAALGCSPVTVTVRSVSFGRQRVAASGVAVDAAGAFSVRIQISDIPDQYAVVASQTSAGGTIQAPPYGLNVLQADRGPSPGPPGVPTPVSTAPASSSGTPIPGAAVAVTPSGAGSVTVGSPGPGGASSRPVPGAVAPAGAGGPAPFWVVFAIAGLLALLAAGGVLALVARRRRRNQG